METFRIGDIVGFNYEGRGHPTNARKGEIVNMSKYSPIDPKLSGITAYVQWDDDSGGWHSVERLIKAYGRGESDAEHQVRVLMVARAERRILSDQQWIEVSESYAFGSTPRSPAQHALESLRGQLRREKMLITCAHILADGILPECGHPVNAAQRDSHTDIWACTEHPGGLLLDTTTLLMAG